MYIYINIRIIRTRTVCIGTLLQRRWNSCANARHRLSCVATWWMVYIRCRNVRDRFVRYYGSVVRIQSDQEISRRFGLIQREKWCDWGYLINTDKWCVWCWENFGSWSENSSRNSLRQPSNFRRRNSTKLTSTNVPPHKPPETSRDLQVTGDVSYSLGRQRLSFPPSVSTARNLHVTSPQVRDARYELVAIHISIASVVYLDSDAAIPGKTWRRRRNILIRLTSS